jgi:hypothetical protein
MRRHLVADIELIVLLPEQDRSVDRLWRYQA